MPDPPCTNHGLNGTLHLFGEDLSTLEHGERLNPHRETQPIESEAGVSSSTGLLHVHYT